MPDESQVSMVPDDVFDPAEIDDLVDDLGPGEVARLLKIGLGDIGERVARLRDVSGDDLTEGCGLAHQLKSLFAQFGALTAAREAAALEACASPQAFAARLLAFEACARRALVWLEDKQAGLALPE